LARNVYVIVICCSCSEMSMTGTFPNYGQEMYDLAKRLWPINRSITGNGVRETLGILKEFMPDLNLYEVPSGSRVFDWVVPNEWNVREAWIEDSDGRKVVENIICIWLDIPPQ